MADYYTWQSPEFSSSPTLAPFTFCQYPFLLSIAAKRNIMQRDSEQQMILMARKSLIQNVQQRQVCQFWDAMSGGRIGSFVWFDCWICRLKAIRSNTHLLPLNK